MTLFINLINVLLAAAGTGLVLFGETSQRGRLTRLGRVVLGCLAVGLVVAIAQQVLSNRSDAEKDFQVITLTERTRETNVRLEEQKRELAAVRAENNLMRESLGRIPQERATASISASDSGQQFLISNSVEWRKYRVNQGAAPVSGPALVLNGGELVRYNVGYRGELSHEPEIYLEAGPWRYPLNNNGEFVVFPVPGGAPLNTAVVANLQRKDFDVHLIVQTTGGTH